MTDKIKELQAQATRLKEQAALLQEQNRLIQQECAREQAEIVANRAQLRNTLEIEGALLAKYNKTQI